MNKKYYVLGSIVCLCRGTLFIHLLCPRVHIVASCHGAMAAAVIKIVMAHLLSARCC